MNKDIVAKTQQTAELYFKDVKGERPFDLWRSFDKDLAKDLSLFITGQMYAREKISHQTRQLITVSALTVLSRLDELRLHIQAALNVGCRPEEIEGLNLDFIDQRRADNRRYMRARHGPGPLRQLAAPLSRP